METITGYFLRNQRDTVALFYGNHNHARLDMRQCLTNLYVLDSGLCPQNKISAHGPHMAHWLMYVISIQHHEKVRVLDIIIPAYGAVRAKYHGKWQS